MKRNAKILLIKMIFFFEKYTGPKSHGYVGEYLTNERKCTCSWFKNRLFCRHQIWFRDYNNLPIFDNCMFNKSLIKPAEDDNINNDFSDVEDNVHETNAANNNSIDYTEDADAPSSPGMGYIMQEERINQRKPPKNDKYDKSCELSRVFTQILPQFSKEAFEDNLNSSYDFINLIRRGLPENLRKYP